MKKFKLENEPKLESGFIVPDHYFDTFSKKVFTQLADKEIKVIPLYKRKKNIFQKKVPKSYTFGKSEVFIVNAA